MQNDWELERSSQKVQRKIAIGMSPFVEKLLMVKINKIFQLHTSQVPIMHWGQEC